MTLQADELMKAIATGDQRTALQLLDRDPGLLSFRDEEGRSPLLFALYCQRQELAAAIRARHPDPDFFELAALGETETLAAHLEASPELARARAPDGFSALGLAVYFGHPETAALLLTSGADPDVPSANPFRVTPLHSAVAHRDAARSLELVRLLLRSGAEPNVKQAGGWTPLHQAAAHGRADIVRLLLEGGAELEAVSEDGRTALDLARAKGRTEVVSLLAGEGG